MMQFKKAEKSKSKLRLAIYGPSGSGKTLSSLLIAKGIGGKIAFIDTEHGRGSIYSDKVEFDVLELENKSIENYIQAINLSAQAEYPILVIDSLTHAWKELLEEMEALTSGRMKGNSFRAWAVGTPKQNRMIDAILTYPGHIIATMRSKTEYVIELNSKGKQAPRKVGLAPEQGKGLEYEFNLLMAIDQAHIATIEKDNTGGDVQDMVIDKPGVEFGGQLVKYLGIPAIAEPPVVQPTTVPMPVNQNQQNVQNYVSENTSETFKKIRRIIPAEEFADDFIWKQVNQFGSSVFDAAWQSHGKAWKRKYIHATKNKAGISEKQYREILARFGLEHGHDAKDIQMTDDIAIMISNTRPEFPPERIEPVFGEIPDPDFQTSATNESPEAFTVPENNQHSRIPDMGF